MKIGVFIGSFDPVHNGHMRIVNHLINNYLDKVVIVATGNYWNKNNLTNIKDRINMLNIFKNEKILIDQEFNLIECTYELFRSIKKLYKNDELYLIMGADNIINFDKWENYEELLCYNLIIINRDDIDINVYLNKLNKKDKYIIVNDLDNMDISSTFIRNMIKNDKIIDIVDKIDSRVLEYITVNKLYKEIYEKDN